MIIQNTIPIYTFILELTTGLFVLLLSGLLFKKYLERRKAATFFLSMTFILEGIAIILLGIGKAMDFFSSRPREEISYTDFTTILAYAIIAFASILLLGFFAYVFNKTSNDLTFALVFLNGITVGLFLAKLSFAFRTYRHLLLYVLYHIIVSIVIYGLIIKESHKIRAKATNPVTKQGFKYIEYFGYLYILSFVFFFLDAALGFLYGTNFTVFYVLAWLSVDLAIYMSYLGYGMPEWFKKKILEQNPI